VRKEKIYLYPFSEATNVAWGCNEPKRIQPRLYQQYCIQGNYVDKSALPGKEGISGFCCE
jgi:hypothetical protein